MNVATFREMYKAELQELCSAEAQLAEALPKMAEKAHHPELKQALQAHAVETRTQQTQLDELVRHHGAKPREHVDQSMQAMLRETDKWAGMIDDPNLRDVGLLASAQRVKHYEIAVYGSLATWAKQLGLDDDLKTLLGSLGKEKRADETLTALAKRVVNPAVA
ncbi:ferritin-like domain-containing protein [Microvirga sp. 2MCAF38]|uniref:YciE/YciF ferroxidase family protein n=1 Tax=Microvirga sp. 2MCAF38 TaxID=3232989 RepID=UPI003F955EF3